MTGLHGCVDVFCVFPVSTCLLVHFLKMWLIYAGVIRDKVTKRSSLLGKITFTLSRGLEPSARPRARSVPA